MWYAVIKYSPSVFVPSRMNSCTIIPQSLHTVCNSQVQMFTKAHCILFPPLRAEGPPPPPVRVTPRYVVLDNSSDLVLEARFRGNFYTHDWQYNKVDSTFITGGTSLFTSANRTNVGQTYTIPAGSASLRVGYYGPFVLPTPLVSLRPTPENTVIVGSFGKSPQLN